MENQLALTQSNLLYKLAEYTDEYKRWLVTQLEEMSTLSQDLRMAYMKGEEKRDIHNALISISCEIWMHLLPKMKDTPFFRDFKKWMPFYVEPRLFILPDYANLIWEFIFVIRMGYEHLGITKIAKGP
jgi:hypothetical protein